MSFEVLDVSESSSKESPIKLKDIRAFLDKELETINDISGLDTTLLKDISVKSSKYKFLVQSTKLVVDDVNVNLDINTKFSAAWESEKDGYITIKLAKSKKVVETESSEDTFKPPTRKDTIGGILDDYIDIEQDKHEQYLLSIFYIYVG